jgi:hypothetical protein
MTGYQISSWGECMHAVLAVCTGFLYLLFVEWFEKLSWSLRYKAVPLSDAGTVRK